MVALESLKDSLEMKLIEAPVNLKELDGVISYNLYVKLTYVNKC